MILIVTNEEDVTADFVVLELQSRKASYRRFNTEGFPQVVGLTVELGEDIASSLTLSKGELRLEDVTAVWYRRPVPPVVDSRIAPPAAKAFAELESAAALQNVWALLRCLWISAPHALRRAEQRLLQLRCAQEIGLRVPPTLVTTRPANALEFVRTHGRVVVKALGQGYVRQAGEPDTLIFTSELEEIDPAILSRVLLAPTLFQELVPRGYDLRVTVVGTSVFATEIHRSPDARGVDWRQDSPQQLVHREHDLPVAMREKVVNLVSSFGLKFAALDFIVDPRGRYFFLELNPNGQWAWIEQELGTPIAAAIADMLCGASS